jgi:hypothetical protein
VGVGDRLMGFPARRRRSAHAIVVTSVARERYSSRARRRNGARARRRQPGRAGRVRDLARARPLPGPALWRDFGFITLASASALSLFAQIGLITHLYSLLVPALGTEWAGLVMGIGTGGRQWAAACWSAP